MEDALGCRNIIVSLMLRRVRELYKDNFQARLCWPLSSSSMSST